MFEPKSILVPTDFSEFSDRALVAAQDLAKKFNSKIYLLHVVDEGIHTCAGQYCLDPTVAEAIKETSQKGAREKMHSEFTRVRGNGFDVEFDVRLGAPYEEILKEQEEKKIDLIIMGSHGRTGHLEHLLGSVAERVSHNAGCPVLIMREH